MRIRILVIALLASLSFAASADNYIINQAYEVAVAELSLPSSAVGSVSFRNCNLCDTQVVRVTAGTRYVLNNRDVALVDFKKAVNTIANKKTNIATVIHHLQSDTVLAVHIFE